MTVPFSNNTQHGGSLNVDIDVGNGSSEGQTLYFDSSKKHYTDSSIIHIDAANSRVGVNKTSPAFALDIQGELRSGKIVLGNTSRLAYSNSQSKMFIGNHAYGTNLEMQLSAYSNGMAFYRGGTYGTNAMSFYSKQIGESSNYPVGSITIGTTSTSYNTSSDYRLKENITDTIGCIEKIKLLKPRTFNFISEPDESVNGFIAHELEAVEPNAVTGEKDGVNPQNEPIYQVIDSSKLIPLLTGALQEAIKRIELLESKIII